MSETEEGATPKNTNYNGKKFITQIGRFAIDERDQANVEREGETDLKECKPWLKVVYHYHQRHLKSLTLVSQKPLDHLSLRSGSD